MGQVNIESNFTAEENSSSTMCAAAIQSLLTQYGCAIVGLPFIDLDGRVRCEIHIVPKRFVPAQRL
jgi:hypothetical protein